MRRNRHILKKEERRHQALQLRKNKREEALSKKRALGGGRNPPFLVCVVPLNAQLDVQSALAILKTCSEGAVVTESDNGILHIRYAMFIIITSSLSTIHILRVFFVIIKYLCIVFQLTKLQATLLICLSRNR